MNRDEERRWWLGLAAIALVAAAARVAAWGELANVWADGGVPNSDAREIEMFAWNVLDGIGFADVIGYWRHDALRMPFFSVFLAGLYALLGEPRAAAQAVLCALSVGTCLAVAGVGRLAFGRRAVGIVAGLLSAVYVPYVAYSIPLVTENTFTFLFVLGVYLLLRATLERGRGFALASGLSFGLAGLTRFTAFAAVPAILLAALFAAAESGRTHRIIGRIVIPCLFAMVLTFSPWVMRNALVLGAFFPGESGGVRQVWTGANPRYGGASYNARAWREMLWRAPEASEIERNRALQRETLEFISAEPSRYVEWSVRRAFHHLDPPRFPASLAGDFLLAPGWVVEVWILSRLGYVGMVLALFRRFSAGLLLGGSFFSLVAFHAIAGEDPRYRLPSEWLWLVGAAYLFVMVTRVGREPLLAAGARDEHAEPPVRGSLIDRYALGVPLLGLAALPFVALAVVAPLRRAERAHVAAPVVAEKLAELVRDSGLEAHFREQGSTLHPVAHYFALARGQPPEEIRYPPDVVVWSGELSHFVARADGSLDTFSFKPGKHGLAIGDAQVPCAVAPNVRLGIPHDAPRRPGVVVGTIRGSSSLGELLLEVAAVWLD